MVDYVQSSYPADERIMAIDGGQVGTMYQAVESITDQLGVYVDRYVYVYVCVCMYICMYVYTYACMHISCTQTSHFPPIKERGSHISGHLSDSRPKQLALIYYALLLLARSTVSEVLYTVK